MSELLSFAEAAGKAAEAYGVRDPYEIAEREGVRVCRYDLGSLNGMYTVLAGVPFIALGASLGKEEERLVCAHELGHHFLHKSLAETAALSDSAIFSGGGRLEYEANVFAAELLIGDGALLEAAKACGDVTCIAAELEVHPELLAIKGEILRKKGYDFNPLDINVDFLRKQLRKRN